MNSRKALASKVQGAVYLRLFLVSRKGAFVNIEAYKVSASLGSALVVYSILLCMLVSSTQAFPRSGDLFSDPNLCKLLILTGLNCEKDPKKLVEITQKNWLREAGKERWEITERFETKSAEILDLVKKLGFNERVLPQKKAYDYALVMGALSSTMKKRLAFLVKQWQEGVRFRHIYILVGERPRHPTMESEKMLFEDNAYLNFPKTWVHPKVLPQTETEIAKMIYKHAEIPQEFRKVPITFVNAPMKLENAKSVRPTTDDTIHHLLEAHSFKKNASILSVSDQPYIQYQHAVLKRILQKNGHYSLETVGDEAAETRKLSIYLDSIARALYAQLALN